MDIPIGSILRSEKLAIAELQDLLIEIIYDYVQYDAVLYGGTAIWRCYNGSRFSEDIDIYVKASFLQKLELELQRQKLKIVWRDPELNSNIRISDGVTEVLLEAKEDEPDNIMSQYMKVNGSSMTISILSSLDLAIRKMEAYSGRLYIRDMYDLVQLTNFIDKKDYYTRSKFKEFLNSVKEPVDEHILESLIYKGFNKWTFRSMVDYLRRWLNEV